MFFKSLIPNVLIISVLAVGVAQSAEWKLEPSVGMSTQYNDNVGMRTEANNPVGSTGYTLDPKINIVAEEQHLWDMSLSTRAKFTRYQDIENSDSNNVYLDFGSGWQTERAMLRLNASFTRNTNFDDDFDTESPIAGLIDDKTERETVSFSPSIRWNLSQTSVVIFSITTSDNSYNEVTSTSFRDYSNDSAQFQAYWQVLEKHTLGYTISYSEQETPDAGYSSDTAILNLDYTYNISQSSDLKLSLGGRRLNSLQENGLFLGCVTPSPFDGPTNCAFSAPILGDLESEDDGFTVNLSYSNQAERASNSFNASRNVVSSSTGSIQEQRSVNYKFSFKNTERFTSNLLLDGSEALTIGGGDSSNDRTRYRVEPSLYYKLSRDWALSFKYSYINQNITDTDEDSTSNAVYINLSLNWPKLATTY